MLKSRLTLTVNQLKLLKTAIRRENRDFNSEESVNVVLLYRRRQNSNFVIGHFYSLSWFLTSPFPSSVVGNINSALLFYAARGRKGNNCQFNPSSYCGVELKIA